MQIRISDIVKESIVDGPGIRFTIFTQGCLHNCKGCHNPQTHSLTDGEMVEIDKIFDDIKKNPLLQGVTFSGGEPFLQPLPLIELAKKIKQIGLDIIIYSGYTYEQIMSNKVEQGEELLKLCDILIDSKFDINKKDLTLKFRGSTNQRIIDVKNSLSSKHVVLIDI